MKASQIAAQLYTVRDHLKTPSDIAASMRKVRAAGYHAVQISGMGPIDDSELARILDGEGLVCCATHEGADDILDEPHEVVAHLDRLNCTYTAYPYPAGIDFASPAAVEDLARRLNESGSVLREAGKVLAYHNHNIEFRHIGGRPALEIIYENTEPENLVSELDTYWVQAGGASPLDWCARMKDRAPLLHLKDFGVNEKNEGVMTEIGSGNIDWKKLVPVAEQSGCEWFIVEQDRNWINGDAFESLKVSYDYIKANLCG
ncbi:MAG: TIM barrel protein [Chitinivibrionales bacterium]|nr:TIM barrel protein [Chitinivibrionales bacterium]MBD3395450.1 TIM barrel protein [Chitinivibrionales bacterium]